MATVHVFGNLDSAIPDVVSQLSQVRKEETVRVKIRSDGGTIGALNQLSMLFQKIKRQRSVTYEVEAVSIRSAALLLFISFHDDERIVTKASKGSIHLPTGTFPGSEVREKTIAFISERTLLSPVQVVYHEYRPLDAKEMVKLGIGKMVH